MPSLKDQKTIVARDGYHCRYCGIPVVDAKIRKAMSLIYPDALTWGRRNSEQHAAFQAMWLTYEHVIPHSRGGDNSFENVIVSCQACNCGKMDYMLEEVGLVDPRNTTIKKNTWDGLTQFLQKPC